MTPEQLKQWATKARNAVYVATPYEVARDIDSLIEQLLAALEEALPKAQWVDELKEAAREGVADIEAGRYKTLTQVLDESHQQALEQLAAAQEREDRLKRFIGTITMLSPDEGLTPTQLWHIVQMAKKALQPDGQ